MSDDDDIARFNAVRSKCPTNTECRLMSERAQDEAAFLVMSKPHARWSLEAGAWQRLAEAAYVCESLLVRRQLTIVKGMPGSKPPKEGA